MKVNLIVPFFRFITSPKSCIENVREVIYDMGNRVDKKKLLKGIYKPFYV